MVTITVEISEERFEALRELANYLKVSPEELARLHIENVVLEPDDAFKRASEYILEKNAELYERLA
jgi:hypothetical protein